MILLVYNHYNNFDWQTLRLDKVCLDFSKDALLSARLADEV